MKEQGYDYPPKIVVSFSGGKDSTAMLIKLVESGYPISAVLFFDTGWEFPEMYRHIEKVEEIGRASCRERVS
jgi:3'-phosphoadenosine 5'-phosphosulfate sulfotransferase (PAPS reductase)/FAD synthetase